MRALVFISFALLAARGLGQTPVPVYVDWPADNVTVFAQGAWVEHRGSVTPAAQRFELILDGLTEAINPQSLQVELPEGWRLVGTQSSTGSRPDETAAAEADLADIEAEIRAVHTTIAMREALSAVYDEELAMIQSNRQLSHQETLLVDDLREAAEFWRSRVRELKYKQLELTQEIADLHGQVEALEAERREAMRRAQAISNQLRMRLHAASEGRGEVAIRYLTQAASWRPEYDVKVSPEGRIVFDRFASVSQTTGSDWEGIPLEFVVGNPLSSLAPPAFERWVLRERTTVQQATAGAYEWAPEDAEGDLIASHDLAFRGVDGLVAASAAEHAFFNDRFRFEPAIAPFVASQRVPERVFIEQFELQGELSYLLKPYASDEAYQMAHSATWATSRLMQGRVQVEAGGVFRGWFDLVLPAPGDTLMVPIGQDPEVRCSRERRADRCSNSVFGGKHKSEQTWEIEVENLHDRPIEARIEERIPVAYRADVTVELLEASGAAHDVADGKLTWDVTLAPGELRTFIVRYRLEYPKELGFVNF